LIESAIKKARNIPRETLLQDQTIGKQTDNSIPLVHTFSPKEPNLYGIVSSSKDILKGSEKMNQILKDTKFVNSSRQAQNLKRMLTKAEFNNAEIPGSKRCKQPRCKTCLHMQETKFMKFN
jgi:hypothetical protein